jgi:uncharacterized protein (UPF0332 family)
MSKEELVKYRYSRAKETFNEAVLLGNENHWNAVANRLYYACFYLVNSLLIQNDLSFNSHNGVKTEFHRSFVKTEKITITSGKLYSRLFNLRHEGDYADFKRFEKEDIEPFIADVEKFFLEIDKLLETR